MSILSDICQYVNLTARFVLLSGMIRWTLKNYLQEHDLSAYRLVQTAEVSPTTIYALARGTHERVSLEVLDKVLAALERLTGKPVEISDLLARDPDPEPQEMDDETKAWMDAELTPPLEPYDWGPEGPPQGGNPVRFVDGQWVVYEAEQA